MSRSTTEKPHFPHADPVKPITVDAGDAGDAFMMQCNQCASAQVEVTYYDVRVHPASGDRYVDLEFRCHTCHRYSQRAYSDN